MQDLPPGSNAIACSAIGRKFSHGRLTMQIPTPGTRLVMEALYPDGAEMFTIQVSEQGTVSYPDPDEASTSTETAVTTLASPSACTDTAYSDRDEEQAGRWNWYLGDGTRPAGLTTTQTADALKQALSWLSNGYNDCNITPGYTEYDVSSLYQGTTTYESDMTTSGGVTSCGDSSIDGRDGQSVVDFGNLDNNGDPPIAKECTWVFPQPGNNNIIESDIRFNTTDKSFYLAIPTGCADRWDLRGVAIHEFGHSYGMGHVSEDTHEYLTMSTVIPDCNNSVRTLGNGDLRSLANTYG